MYFTIIQQLITYLLVKKLSHIFNYKPRININIPLIKIRIVTSKYF